MPKLQLTWALLCACISLLATTQDSLRTAANKASSDTLKARLYTELSKEWAPSNFDSSFHYATLAISEAKKSNSSTRLGSAYNAAALAYGYDYRPTESWPYYQKAIIEFLRTGDQEQAGAMYSNSGVGYYLTGQLDTAMIRYTSALLMHAAVDAKEKLAKAYNNIALIYNKLGLVEEAINYYNKSLKIKQEMGNTEGIMNTQLNLSSLYYTQNQYDSAKHHAIAALGKSISLGDVDLEAGARQSLGQTYAELGQLDSAIYQCDKAYLLAQDAGLRARQLRSAASLAYYFRVDGQVDKAVQYAREALEEGGDVIDPMPQSMCYGTLAEFAESNGNVGEALNAKKMQLMFLDSALRQEKHAQVAEIVTKYEQSVKKQDLLKTEAVLANAESDKNRLFAIAALGVSVAFFLMLVLIIISLRMRRKRAKSEAQILEQVRLIDSLQEKLAVQGELVPPSTPISVDPQKVNALLKNQLTEREIEVLAAVAAGKTNKQVAEELFVSINTVKTHLARVYEKLNVSNRTEAADKASRLHLLDE